MMQIVATVIPLALDVWNLVVVLGDCLHYVLARRRILVVQVHHVSLLAAVLFAQLRKGENLVSCCIHWPFFTWCC